jgi:hypothetical protein
MITFRDADRLASRHQRIVLACAEQPRRMADHGLDDASTIRHQHHTMYEES